jgi:hypothetical protein
MRFVVPAHCSGRTELAASRCLVSTVVGMFVHAKMTFRASFVGRRSCLSVSTLLGLAFWRYGWAVAVVIAYSVSYAQPARATWISVYVLAPTPPVSLLSVEKHGTDPRFKKEFSIHYDLVEQLIPDEIKKKVDSSKEGTAGCPTFACPDLHWKISIKSGFAFTDKGQPVLTRANRY